MAEPTERIAVLLELQQQEFEKRAKSAGNAIDRLERKFNPLAAAEAKLEKQQLRFNAALEAGTIDAAQHAKGMDLLQREYTQTAARLTGATKNVVAMNGSVAASTGFMNRNRQVFQQAGYQVGDFAVQVQGGQSAITAFTQQGSQMLGVFGAYGAIAGAVLAVGAPIIASFINSGETAATYGDAVDELEASMLAYKEAVTLASLSTAELSEKFGEGSEVLRGQIELLRELAMAQAITDAQTAAAALSEEYADLFRSLDSAGRSGRNAVLRMASDFGLTKQEALSLKDALEAIGNATGPAEISAAAIQLNDILIEAYGSAQEVPEAFRDMATAAAEAAIATQDLQSDIDATRMTAFEMVDAIWGAADALGGSLPNADALLGRIQSLAKAAWDYAGALGAASVQGGRGADPRQFGGGLRDVNNPENRLIVNPGASRARAVTISSRSSGGGGGSRGGGRRSSGSSSGGGRSGSSSRELPDLFTIAEEELSRLERQIELVGKSAGEVATLKTKYDLLDEAKKRGIPITDELTAKIDAEAAGVGALADKYEQAQDRVAALEQINGQFEDAITNAAMGGVDSFDQLTEAIKKAAFQYAVFGSGPLAGLFGGDTGGKSGGGFGGLLGGLLSFDGGGTTGGGARTGGLDGKGGFPAILHPNETVIDHTKGQRAAQASSNQTTRIEFVNPTITATDDGQVMMQTQAQVANGINRNNSTVANRQRRK